MRRFPLHMALARARKPERPEGRTLDFETELKRRKFPPNSRLARALAGEFTDGTRAANLAANATAARFTFWTADDIAEIVKTALLIYADASDHFEQEQEGNTTGQTQEQP